MKLSKTEYIQQSNKTPHVIIEGNNLDVLSDLHRIYDNKVNLIYIDPPYNRGDTYKFYSDQCEHNMWLANIKKVLSELKSFLADDGSIWISIDDNEMAYLKVVCDEVFERKNCAATIVWQKRTTRENRKTFSNNHEYVLVYVLDQKKFKKKRHLLSAPAELLKRYKNPDNDPRGPWQSVTLNVQAGHAVASQFYTITSPTGVKHNPPQGRCWIYNEDRMKKEIAQNNIWFGKNGANAPRLKKFLKNANTGVVPETLWIADYAGTTKDAKKELLDLGIFDKNVFDTPKPEKLLYNILKIATDENDIVLDCFLGSGTTAAVAHKMHRNYIGIDINSEIIDYVQARLNEVINGESGGVSKITNWDGGGTYDLCKWV